MPCGDLGQDFESALGCGKGLWDLSEHHYVREGDHGAWAVRVFPGLPRLDVVAPEVGEGDGEAHPVGVLGESEYVADGYGGVGGELVGGDVVDDGAGEVVLVLELLE